MNTSSASPRRLGIAWRIALLSWLIALATLAVFVLVVIPEQKRIHLESLESKARAISASLQDVTSGAAISEDYSTVTEHCNQVLQGDRSIEFLLITKNDGFSLIHQNSSPAKSATPPSGAQWRQETLSAAWRPTERKPRSVIETVPLINQRLYHYAKPFDYSGIEWGWVHIGLSLEAYDRSVESVYRRTIVLAAGCLVLSLAASAFYARRLIRPLLDLNTVVGRVSAGDLTTRAEIRTGDEIQDLAASFNAMTEALLRRDRFLKEANETLEQRVRERTQELQDQVAASDRANRELAEAQRRLMQLSRQAGMAEIATGVLHNVGNVLNSVNVSSNLLRDGLSPRHPRVKLLHQTTDLIRAQHDLGTFLTTDPRGKLVPPLLVELSGQLAEHHQWLLGEVDQLVGNIDHIKRIVAVQQDYAKSGGVIESFDPAELFAESLRLVESSTKRHQVSITQSYPQQSPAQIHTDRHQVIQILVNFLTNAIQAVKVRPVGQRFIRLTLDYTDHRWRFGVEDNGIGIPPENLQQIFQQGFTTRRDGHGFGLHSGALAARHLGGQVLTHSAGHDCGARFTLDLPAAHTSTATTTS